MKTILEIARIQLARLFFSPVVWLVIIILFMQVGYAFTDRLEYYESILRKNIYWHSLTKWIFTETGLGRAGVFSSFAKNLYLYLPLLTMGLISAELSSGSIKLLYSSPLSVRQLVLGKYLSMVAFSLLFVICLSFFVLAGYFVIDQFDLKLMLSGFLGVFLLSCAYAAVGVFISSLSSSQIVVAISTFVVLSFLNFLPQLGQETPIIRDITFWLSMTSRSDDMIRGLIRSQDIVYFLVIIPLFITITIIRLEAIQKSQRLWRQWVSYAAVVSLAVAVGGVSSMPFLRWYRDMTRTQENTIHESSQSLLSSMTEGPLVMNIYANILDANFGSALPAVQNADIRRLERYQRFKPDMLFNYIYFYDSVHNSLLFNENEKLTLKELAKKVSGAHGLDFDKILSPKEIREIVDLREEENQYVRQFEYNGRKEFVRMFDGINHYPGDDQIMAAMKKMVVMKKTIGFVTGHEERGYVRNSDDDYRQEFSLRHQFKNSLRNLGLNFEEVHLGEGISSHIDILVIADAKTSFSDEEVLEVIGFIESGKNLLITLEPDQADKIQSILDYLGVSQVKGELKAINKQDFDPNLILSRFVRHEGMYPNYWVGKYAAEYDYPITMPGASALAYDTTLTEYIIKPFLVAKEVLSDSMELDKTNVPTALMLSKSIGEDEQRIMIFGDADFADNSEVERRNMMSMNGRGFIPFLFHWLSNGEFPLDLSRKDGIDAKLNLAEKEGQTASLLQMIYIGIIPGLLLVVGGLLLIVRKRK